MPNANYGEYNDTNPANYAAFAIEKLIKGDWMHNYARAHTILAAIRGNDLSELTKDQTVGGRACIVPVVTTAHAATVGLASSAAATGQTLNRSVGATQAEYPWTLYVNNYVLSAQEARLIKGNNLSVRGNMVKKLKGQIEQSFNEKLSTDLASTTIHSETKVMGTAFALNATNVVGGIDQAADANWVSNVVAVGGALTSQQATDTMNLMQTFGPMGGTVDIILASAPAASPDLYSKFEQFVVQQRTVVSDRDKANYGIAAFKFKDAAVFRDHRLTGGTVQGLNSSTWFWAGDMYPKTCNNDPYQVAGNPSETAIFQMLCSFGTNAPNLNFIMSGITG